MGEANCNFDNFLPGGVDCSGFGTCDFNNVTQKSFCVCEAGRRAIGDLVFDPIDCDQSDLGITICWSILLVCSSISAIYGTYELIEQALMPKTNRGLYLNIALATAAAILACVAATLKLFEEEQRLLGEDVLFSVIVPTVGVLYWVSVILFIDRLFVAIVGSTKTGVIDVVTTSAPRITLVTLVGISFILPPVLCGVDQGNCTEYTRLFFFGHFFLITIGGGYAIYASRKLLQALDQAFNTQDRENPIQKSRVNSVKLLQARLRTLVFYTKIGVAQSVPLAVMGCWPFMLRKFSYCLPLMSSPAFLVCTAFISVLSSSAYPSRRLPRILSAIGRKLGTERSQATDETITGFDI